MSQKIQVRRGTDATRQFVVFDQGEPVYTTDTKKLYVGDGVTMGGVPLSNNNYGDSYIEIRPVSGSTAIENGTILRNAIIDSAKKNPYNLSRSLTNPYKILLYPAQYKTTGISHNMCLPRGTQIIGIGDGIRWDLNLHTDSIGLQVSGESRVENIFFSSDWPIIVPGYTDVNARISGLAFKNITYSGYAASFFYALNNYPVEDIVIDNVNPYDSPEAFLINAATTSLKNLTIKNLDYIASDFLDSSTTSNIQNVTIENSRFKIASQTSTLSATGINNLLIKNCYFESGSLFTAAGSNNSRTNNIENCHFLNMSAINSNGFFLKILGFRAAIF